MIEQSTNFGVATESFSFLNIIYTGGYSSLKCENIFIMKIYLGTEVCHSMQLRCQALIVCS